MNHNRLILLIFVLFLFVSFVSAAAPTKDATTDGDYPWIRYNEIGDHYVGEQFTISGTTNLPVDDNLIVEIVSSSFSPTKEVQSGEYSGQAEAVKVVRGDTNNKWSMYVDASTFKPDEYIVNAESIETDSTATTAFNLLAKGGATATPTTKTASKTPTITLPPPTSDITAASTTIPQAPPATTAAAPGFGVLISLIALGTAAVLFLRKE